MAAHVLPLRTGIAGTLLSLVALVGACEAGGGDLDDETTDPSAGIVTIGDDSSSDDESSSDDSSSSDDGVVLWCGESEITVAPAVPQIMLVLDKSHSMVSNAWDHDGDAGTAPVTRWHSLHDVVAQLGGDLGGNMEIGALMFPSVALTSNDSATACEVPASPDVAVGLDNGAAIVAAMPAADSDEIWGGTPTSAAIATAAAELRALDGDAPKAIVLVTDGAANCMEGVAENEMFTRYDDDLAPLVADTFTDDGIPTYVVGIDIVDELVDVPHINPHDALAEVAIAGGAARDGEDAFYNTRDEGELTAALGEITGALQCQLPLTDVPAVPSRVHLVLDGDDVGYSADCSDANGWRYVGDGTAVELCSAACDDFVASGTLHAGFDCVPEK